MRKLTFAMNLSLDGFIAAPGDDLGWSVPSDELFQWWSDRVGATGLALYGRKLWQGMSSHWPTADRQPGVVQLLDAVGSLLDGHLLEHGDQVDGGSTRSEQRGHRVGLRLDGAHLRQSGQLVVDVEELGDAAGRPSGRRTRPPRPGSGRRARGPRRRASGDTRIRLGARGAMTPARRWRRAHHSARGSAR